MNPNEHRGNLRRWQALLVCVLLNLGLSLQAAATERDYALDPVHSRVWFEVAHLKFSNALGTFSGPRGWVRFDPDDFSRASAEIELDLRTLDLGDSAWNARIGRSDGLDSERHPHARFVSERVEVIDRRRFRLHGQLQLRGQQVPLSLDVHFNHLGRHPLTLRRTAGFSATATLDRRALGITAWERMVGQQVRIDIEVEAQRRRRPPPLPGDSP